MSQENVEIVRQAFERLNRGDVDGVIELCDEAFVIDMSERVFNPDVYHGHDGIRRFYEGVVDAWEHYEWNVEDALTAQDAVVAMLHCLGHGRGSGLEIDWRVAWIWTVRDGRATSLRFYRDRDRAVEAVGLSE
jgi:ketosteroid isomerase-like protein